MRLFIKGFLKGTAHMAGTITLEELVAELRKGNEVNIEVACDDIRERGYCPGGNHTGTILISPIHTSR